MSILQACQTRPQLTTLFRLAPDVTLLGASLGRTSLATSPLVLGNVRDRPKESRSGFSSLAEACTRGLVASWLESEPSSAAAGCAAAAAAAATAAVGAGCLAAAELPAAAAGLLALAAGADGWELVPAAALACIPARGSCSERESSRRTGLAAEAAGAGVRGALWAGMQCEALYLAYSTAAGAAGPAAQFSCCRTLHARVLGLGHPAPLLHTLPGAGPRRSPACRPDPPRFSQSCCTPTDSPSSWLPCSSLVRSSAVRRTAWQWWSWVLAWCSWVLASWWRCSSSTCRGCSVCITANCQLCKRSSSGASSRAAPPQPHLRGHPVQAALQPLLAQLQAQQRVNAALHYCCWENAGFRGPSPPPLDVLLLLLTSMWAAPSCTPSSLSVLQGPALGPSYPTRRRVPPTHQPSTTTTLMEHEQEYTGLLLGTGSWRQRLAPILCSAPDKSFTSLAAACHRHLAARALALVARPDALAAQPSLYILHTKSAQPVPGVTPLSDPQLVPPALAALDLRAYTWTWDSISTGSPTFLPLNAAAPTIAACGSVMVSLQLRPVRLCKGGGFGRAGGVPCMHAVPYCRVASQRLLRPAQ